ncbi:uracil-DNA glycosylase [Bacillus sp. V3-13]|nr:uracil-DNA glycosylase [Bacillus sp. V3-13]
MDKQRINCIKCRYYYVTWDSKFPKGCKAYEFKSRNLPSLEVFRASGQPCLRHETK